MARSDFETDSYDPSHIYAGGTKDAEGHSTNLRCKVPDTWSGMLTHLAESPEWPEYPSVAAVIRDALYHRLKWTSQQKDRDIGSHYRMMLALSRTLNDMTSIRFDYTAMRENIETACKNAFHDGDYDSVHNVVEKFREQLDHMPSPYREKIELDLDLWEKRVVNR